MNDTRTQSRSRSTFLSLAIVAALMTTASTGAAMRHLKLLRSFPAADTTFTSSPDAVRLWFSEATELPATKIDVTTQAGAAVMTAAPTRAADKGAPAVAMFKSPLTAGGYKVTWKAMSKDGHVVNGTIAFTVGGSK
jgi:methionine-rich copper-binding protein CopC